jgi:hypothetical protein
VSREQRERARERCQTFLGGFTGSTTSLGEDPLFSDAQGTIGARTMMLDPSPRERCQTFLARERCQTFLGGFTGSTTSLGEDPLFSDAQGTIGARTMMLDPSALAPEDASGTAWAGLNRGFLCGDELRADLPQGPASFACTALVRP